VKLADDNALGTVHDEGACIGHERDFAHVDFLFLGGLLVLVAEGDIKGCAIGLTVNLTLDRGDLGLLQCVAHKVEIRLLLEAVDGEKFSEDGLKTDILALRGLDTRLEEFLVRPDLQFNEVRGLDGLVQFSEGDTFRHGACFGLARLGLPRCRGGDCSDQAVARSKKSDL
jgi:hypothetical protein